VFKGGTVMRKVFVLITFCILFLLSVGCGKSVYTETGNQYVTSKANQTSEIIDENSSRDLSTIPEIDDKALIDKLDKKSDESISYVYNLSPDNITVGDKYEGDFTGSGKPELMVIFKLLGMPHAGGLDCSVAAVYDRQTLEVITQKTFPADECKFAIWTDDKGRGYLAFSGTTTYQGYSTYTFQVFKPGAVWEQVLPQDNSEYSNQNMKFELMQGDIVRVYQPVDKTDGSGDNPILEKKYDLKWNPTTCKLEKYIPAK
jgi:hypothetical protein